jgi:hypothetical protein
MRDRTDIDRTHSLAISQEIGERLQAFLGGQPAPAPGLSKKIERICELEQQSPAMLPSVSASSRNRANSCGGSSDVDGENADVDPSSRRSQKVCPLTWGS